MFTEPDIAVVNVCAAVLPLSGGFAGGETRDKGTGTGNVRGNGEERERRTEGK